MNARNVTIVTTQGNQEETISSNATTWGTLRDEISNKTSFNMSDTKAIIKGLRLGLNEASDALPEGDFTIYVTPSKIKSGRFLLLA